MSLLPRLVRCAPLAALFVLGCSTEPTTPSSGPTATAAPKASAVAAAQAPALPAGSFGGPLSIETPFVALTDVLANPAAWAGKRVRTRGEVIAVCQSAGCWADLRPEGATAATLPTHVTMHGHAFFLPKTAKSKVAEVEGTLSVRALSQEECDHFNAEGASLVAGAPVLGVDAIGVALR